MTKNRSNIDILRLIAIFERYNARTQELLEDEEIETFNQIRKRYACPWFGGMTKVSRCQRPKGHVGKHRWVLEGLKDRDE